MVFTVQPIQRRHNNHSRREIISAAMVVLVIVVLLSATLHIAYGQTVVAPEGKTITLSGEVRRVYGYGPPGYGEDKKHNARITYWVLELTRPINVPCVPEKPEWAKEDCQGTKQLKLFFPALPGNNELEAKARRMQGHRILVTGVLHRSDTMGEITPIYMNAIDFQPAEDPPRR